MNKTHFLIVKAEVAVIEDKQALQQKQRQENEM